MLYSRGYKIAIVLLIIFAGILLFSGCGGKNIQQWPLDPNAERDEEAFRYFDIDDFGNLAFKDHWLWVDKYLTVNPININIVVNEKLDRTVVSASEFSSQYHNDEYSDWAAKHLLLEVPDKEEKIKWEKYLQDVSHVGIIPLDFIQNNEARQSVTFRINALKKIGIHISDGDILGNILYSSDFEIIERWLAQLERAVSILPKAVVDTAIKGGVHPELYVNFVHGLGSWTTGRMRSEDRIEISLHPHPFHPFPFEYVSEGGYTDEEMLYGWIHELGHLWHFNATDAQQVEAQSFIEGAVSRYGCIDYAESCLEKDIITIEDFAEGFAFYILIPDYLRENFPERYEWLSNNVFEGKNITLKYEAPSSLFVRLTATYTQ